MIFRNKNVKDFKKIKVIEKIGLIGFIVLAIILCIGVIYLTYMMVQNIESYLISPGKYVSLRDIYLGLVLLGADIVLVIGDIFLAACCWVKSRFSI